MPRPKRPTSADMTLRLKQNAYVRGELAFTGDTFTFPRVEAEKRLKTTSFWEIV